MSEIRDRIFGMSGAARDVLRQLFLNGPTQDGDISSKSGRGDLCELGYAHHEFGHAWLTREGVEFAIKSMALDDEKERRDRERRRGVGR